jgi:COMPASS component SWD3
MMAAPNTTSTRATSNSGDDNSDSVKFSEYWNTIGAHPRGVTCVKFSHDGSRIASAGASGHIYIWDTDTGKKLLHCFDEKSGHSSIASTIGQTTTTTTTTTSTTSTTSTTTSTSTSSSSGSGSALGINDVAWSHDSKLLCSCGDDRRVVLWDTSDGKALRRFEGHLNTVMCVNFNPESVFIASGSYDETVRLWEVTNGKCLKTLPVHAEAVTAVDFCAQKPDIFITGSYDGLCRMWNVKSQCIATILEEHPPPVAFARFAPNGKFVLTSNLDSAIRLFDVDKREIYPHGKKKKVFRGHVNRKHSLFAAFLTVQDSSSNNAYVVSGSEDSTVCVWNINSKKLVQKIQGHCDVVIGVDCHPKRMLIVSGGGPRDGSVRVWRNKPQQQ